MLNSQKIIFDSKIQGLQITSIICLIMVIICLPYGVNFRSLCGCYLKFDFNFTIELNAIGIEHITSQYTL